MKLLQFFIRSIGTRVGFLEQDSIIDITCKEEGLHSTNDLVAIAQDQNVDLSTLVNQFINKDSKRYSYRKLIESVSEKQSSILMPVFPGEIWGCGMTYERGVEVLRAESKAGDIYSRVFEAERPYIFFKTTLSRCVGPNSNICIRRDSRYTIPEPELGLVLNGKGHLIGYTITNDVSACDIERDNPLYLCQAKTYQGCCAIGPVLVLRDFVRDVKNLKIVCRIFREGKYIFDESTCTSRIGRSLSELIDCVIASNIVVSPTIIMTGTGILVPPEAGLRDGDQVEIEIEEIGVLRNYVKQL
jgi:2-dehydro-3-deoxy-D-arabinonate dehydratase